MALESTGVIHERVLEADSDVRLDLFVARWLELSRTQAATLIATGGVTVDGRNEKASYRPQCNERVVVKLPERSAPDVVGESIPLSVAYEDDSVLVIDKPPGMVVHPAPGNWSGTLVNALVGRIETQRHIGPPARAGIVHRLDKETSGLLLVAKTERAHRVLSSALASRRIIRRYAAICWGHLDADEVTVDRALARDPRNRKRMAVVATGKPSRTVFHRLARFPDADLLRAHLSTGRTHQIRIHLASLGHPVLGDDTYGGGGGRRLVGLPPHRHFLHAAWLRFRHPVTGMAIDIRSPLPDDLRQSLAQVAHDPELVRHSDPLDVFDFYRVA